MLKRYYLRVAMHLANQVITLKFLQSQCIIRFDCYSQRKNWKISEYFVFVEILKESTTFFLNCRFKIELSMKKFVRTTIDPLSVHYNWIASFLSIFDKILRQFCIRTDNLRYTQIIATLVSINYIFVDNASVVSNGINEIQYF